MNGSPKENENPKIYDVGNKVREFGDSSCIWSAFNSLTTYDNDFQDISTSTNGSIINALRDASESRDRKAISLLLNSGLILSHPGDGSGRFICRFPIQISGFNSTATTARTDEPLEQSGISKEEIFDIIRNIQDPEHPLTLEQLGVVSLNQITMEVSNYDSSLYTLDVRFTPTIPHCSMATLIGLAIRVKLLRSLPNNDRYKVTVRIEPGTHNSEISVNKQLADKERVCAALENKHLLGVVNKCIASGMRA